MRSSHPPVPFRERLVAIWFGLDAVVALSPPLYWAADGAVTPILGIPAALFYFLAVSAFISASIVYACLADGDRSAGS